MKNTLLITGSSGYVGAMLVDQFSKRDDVEKIIGIDNNLPEDFIKDNEKLVFIQHDLGDDGWEEEVEKYKPNIVIHTAWQIRELYGQKDKQWQMNIHGSDNVFDYAFSHPEVERLIHFSTVASYGAFPDNQINELFTEEDAFRVTDYLYAEEKRIAELHLKEREGRREKGEGKKPKVFIIRPAAITGPRGRFMRVRFGLQSALSGQLKKEKSFWYRFISKMVSFTPVTEKWCRQFVHEDDINDIVKTLAFDLVDSRFEIFNASPPGEVVRGKDMAKAVGKKAVKIYPFIIRIVFFLMHHLSLGKIPTSRGGWKSYSYPIAVDGSKITRELDYEYKTDSLNAFTSKEGRYKEYTK
jgi:nucleoside-diphosphate-sugar epimerase